MAFGVIACCRDHGLRVPEDVSVVGLTTVRRPAAVMGVRAAELLLAHVENKAGAPVVAEELAPTDLQVRAGVAPPAA